MEIPSEISTSPFTSLVSKLIVSVSEPEYRNDNSYITFQVSTYHHDIPASTLPTIVGIASIYPIQNKIKTTVYRRWTHFEKLYAACLALFPFCVVPPLPDKGFTLVGKVSMAENEARSRFLHVFLSRLAQHPTIGISPLFEQFLTLDDEDAINDLLSTVAAAPPKDYSSYAKFDAFRKDAHAGAGAFATVKQYLPLYCYDQISNHITTSTLPSIYNSCRSSVWNMCATTIESSQGVNAQGSSSSSSSSSTTTAHSAAESSSPFDADPDYSASSSGGERHSTSTGTTTTTLNPLLHPDITLSSDRQSDDKNPMDTSSHQIRSQLVLDHRTHEDGVRVNNYMAVLTNRLSSLSTVLAEFDKQQVSLASNLTAVGTAIENWARFELYHRDDIHVLLTSLSVALSRPFIESIPSYTRLMIIDYIDDIIRHMACIRQVLDFRQRVLDRRNAMQKTFTERNNRLEQLNNLSSPTPLQEQQKKELTAECAHMEAAVTKQEEYLVIVNAFMIIELAHWRYKKRKELRQCVRAYVLAQRHLAAERVRVWETVEHDLLENELLERKLAAGGGSVGISANNTMESTTAGEGEGAHDA